MADLQSLHYIKDVMKRKGVTVTELANRLGVSKQAASACLTHDLRLSRLKQIADVLDTTLVELFTPPVISEEVLIARSKDIEEVQDDNFTLSDVTEDKKHAETNIITERKELCNLLTSFKDYYSLKWVDITNKTGVDEGSLYKLFSGKTNFFIESAITIAKSVHTLIIVQKNSESTALETNALAVQWAKDALSECSLTIAKTSELTQISRESIRANLTGTSKMRIDTLFKIAEITGYTVLLSADYMHILQTKCNRHTISKSICS